MTRFALLLALATALPAMAVALDGTYDTDCALEISDMRVTITGDSINFWETACSLTDPVNIRDMDGATLYDAVCEGEGEEWTQRVLLMPRHDGGLILVQSGVSASYDRCG